MDMHLVDQATPLALAMGVRVANAFMFHEDEREHVRRLLEVMDPPANAVVVDAGCGVGEVAALMRSFRPDLRFKLVNLSQLQLDHCPADMAHIKASFDAMPLANASADVVMFNYAICHTDDLDATMREARRVLKEGGLLFVNDMVRRGGTNDMIKRVMESTAFSADTMIGTAHRCGFELEDAIEPVECVRRLRAVMDNDQMYDAMYGQVDPIVYRFVRRTAADPVASAFQRHERIAFQFSGGRDSTAALYTLRQYWDRMKVYHLDTGDHWPETREVVDRVGADVPIEIVRADVVTAREQHGWPSDLVPVDNTDFGRKVSGREVKIVSRYDCCWRNLMLPMHQRMVADGITLIVRGQRDEDFKTPPMRSGQAEGGFEVLYPIQHWTTAEVDEYLKVSNLPVSRFYAGGMPHGSDCMGCTAWWDDRRAGYMREHHPVAFHRYKGRMETIRAEVDRQYEFMRQEMEGR